MLNLWVQVRSFGKEGAAQERYYSALERMLGVGLRSARLYGAFMALTNLPIGNPLTSLPLA